MEVTVLDEGFVKAWEIGAREWRANASGDQAELIPIQTAWQAYEPIGFDQEQRPVLAVPEESELLRAYTAQLEAFVSQAIEPRVAEIRRQLDARGPSAVLYNRLGVLYARYEMTGDAQHALQRAVELGPLPHAYLNLGHLAYMQEDYQSALGYYEQAEELAPDDDAVVLGISRAQHELENYGYAIRYYEKLQASNPDMADRFAYLQFRASDTGRASDAASMQNVIVWGENDE